MSARLVWVALWAGSVILAWFLGTSRTEDAGRAERVERPPAPRESMGMEARKGEETTSPDASPAPNAAASDGASSRSGGVPPKPKPLDFDALKTAQQFSDEAMAIVEAHLRRGPEGQRDLLVFLSELGAHETQLEMLFMADMNNLPKLMYPWLKLIVRREKEVVEFVDTTFRTAVENPEWFEKLDADTLALITEMIGPVLPGMTSDKVIARIRKNLGKLLAKGESALPESLADHFDSLRELHEAWAGPLALEEARKALLDPSVSVDEKFAILKRSPPAAAEGIELAPILVAGLDHDHWETLAQCRRFRLGARDRIVLDEAIYEELAGDDGYGAWIVGEYLVATGREAWEQQRPFFDDGVRRGGKIRTALLMALQAVDEVPERYVRQMLGLPDLTTDEREHLEALLLEPEPEDDE